MDGPVTTFWYVNMDYGGVFIVAFSGFMIPRFNMRAELGLTQNGLTCMVGIAWIWLV